MGEGKACPLSTVLGRRDRGKGYSNPTSSFARARWPAPQIMTASTAGRLSPRRSEPVGPAPLETIERAIARPAQRWDVVGQEHEPKRQHPEAENRQDGEAAADDQQYAGRDARPARGGLSEPAGRGLHAPRQAAEEPPQPPLMIDADDIVGKGHAPR